MRCLHVFAAACAWAAPPPPIRFTDVAAEAGLEFVLSHHPTPDKHMIETMPGGVAAFDYDADGKTDIFFTNGAVIPSMKKESLAYWNRLFRNEGNWRFRDVTSQAGVAGEGYSMGAAAGDFDNDGHTDLFVAGVYRNLLYRNLGDGRFADVTVQSGIASDRWSVTGGWFDYDNDGLLDLLVINYSHWSPRNPRYCGDSARALRVYCHPRYFDPVPNQLYRNLGRGRFADVSSETGIARHAGRGMGVAFADYDADGRLDAFVTNDNLPNSLFRNAGPGNRGHWRFEETALASGCALLDHGKPVASMGSDFRDFDNDGRPDIVVTALAGETFPLFRNEGGGLFRDATHSSRLAPLVARRSGWGVAFADFNNDGWKDLFTANSHVNDIVEKFEAFHYKEPNSVFANLGAGNWRDDSETFRLARAHRGAAVADFDHDGRLDIVVSALGEPAQLWRNRTEPVAGWLTVRLEGTRSNRNGIGARISAEGQVNLMTSAMSYSSASHVPVHFGLGAARRVDKLVISWPSGRVQTLESVPADQIVVMREAAR